MPTRKFLFKFSSVGQSLIVNPIVHDWESRWHGLCYRLTVMSARYIPAKTAKIIDGLKPLLERNASASEVLEFLFAVQQESGGWGIGLNDLFKRYRSFWSIIDERQLPLLDSRHQAMFALVAKNDSNWITRFFAIVKSTNVQSALTKSFFALFLLARQAITLRTEEMNTFVSTRQPNGAQFPFSPNTKLSSPFAFTRDMFFGRTIQPFEKGLPKDFKEAMDDDNPSQFEILRTLLNKSLTQSLVKALFMHNAVKIIIHHLGTVEQIIAPKDILFFCVSSMPKSSIALINALNNKSPNLVRNARDIFGNNALWYGLHRLGENKCSSQIERLLLDLGCDPNTSNCYGLSYDSMLRAKEALKTI